MSAGLSVRCKKSQNEALHVSLCVFAHVVAQEEIISLGVLQGKRGGEVTWLKSQRSANEHQH